MSPWKAAGDNLLNCFYRCVHVQQINKKTHLVCKSLGLDHAIVALVIYLLLFDLP